MKKFNDINVEELAHIAHSKIKGIENLLIKKKKQNKIKLLYKIVDELIKRTEKNYGIYLNQEDKKLFKWFICFDTKRHITKKTFYDISKSLEILLKEQNH